MSRYGFSLKDLIALAAVFAVLTVGLIGCGRATSGKQRMVNGTQVRGVHSAMLIFSQGNNDFYPGLGPDGNAADAIPAGDNQYGAPKASNSDISIVYALLIWGAYIPPDYPIHPLDADSKTPAPSPSGGHTMTRANYSYALLQFGDDTGNEGRRGEWRGTNNSMAPLVADRSKIIDPSMKFTGMHDGDDSGDPTKWNGHVGWNDNHVTFENSAVFAPGKLKFGGTPNDKPDNLFDASDGTSPDGNAMFTY